MKKILFDLKKKYYFNSLFPIYKELEKDSNYNIYFNIGKDQKRFLGIFLLSQKNEIAKSLQKKGLKLTDKKMVAIAPGSVWFTKRWPNNYYKELASELANSGYFIVLTGSRNEQYLCEEIKPIRNSVNFSGKLSILESAELIRRCEFIICNDSGALHIANAVKTKVYTFFGPTVKTIGYAPFRKNDHVFETELKCRPCGSHGGKSCPEKHHNCMRKITPELVLSKIQKDFKEK